ncbi:hypothetical protein LCGC14_0388490 [marine sediment metagenome]|uniref:Uncharacterized protein n=1 Tax=marine sediment metagenome TaxID=412755 RepID=A0A0F9TIC2_9ZZZZ
MAATIIPSDAVITQTVSYTEGAETRTVTFSKTVSSVADSMNRLVEVPTSEVDLATLTSAAVGKGQSESFNFFSLMNRDDTNFLRLRIYQTGGDTMDIKLEASDWFTIWNSKLEVNTAQEAFVVFVDWDTIAVQADTAPIQAEFVALIV